MSKPIEIIILKNGLKLEIYNHSRKVAGDRWLVFFEARIDVDVKKDYFSNNNPGIPYEEVIKDLGEKVTFRYEKQRNFIDVREKDRIFEELKGQFLKTVVNYISGHDFPKRFILNRYCQKKGKIKGLIKF